MPSVKAVLREEANKRGEHAIMLRIIIGRRVRHHSLKHSVRAEFWNPHTQRVRPREGNAAFLNHLIAKRVKEVLDIFHDFEVEGKPLTIETFGEVYKRNGGRQIDFYAFFEQELGERSDRRSLSTRQNHEAMCLKLKTFRPTLHLSSMDYDLLDRFEAYLLDKGKGGLSRNTANTYLRILRTYLNIAHKKGYLKSLSWQQYTPPAFISNRDFLDEEGIRKLMEVGLEKGTEKNVQNMFLFACCTGLRFGELRNLLWDQIGEDMISIDRNTKTRRQRRVPLIPLAKELLNRIARSKDNTKVFKPITNAHYNNILQQTGKKAGLTVALTSHVARHTFATQALNNGIPMEVVSDLLGHTSIKTTQVYAKLMDARKIEEMKKLRIGALQTTGAG